jgi:Flp pilus assembly pilin Flp
VTTRRRRRGEAGQTFVETTMILGLLTAIIVGVTGIVVPGFSNVVATLVRHMLVYVGAAH